jgi:hypothetical protein
VANQHTYQLINNSTWNRDKHTVLFGGTWRREYWTFQRTDQLAGSLTTPVALVNQGTNVSIPTTARPPTCSATLTTNCLLSADAGRFTQLFASSLGIVDNVSVLAMRDTNLQPLPLGTPQDLETRTDAFEFYINDSWRPTSALTLNLGLSYQFKLAPQERLDRYAFLIDYGSARSSTARPTSSARSAGGATMQPQAGVSADHERRRADITSRLVQPWSRIAATWNPPFETGWLGKVLKHDNAVLRGGYGLVFDRTNSVQHIFALGMGCGENLSLLAPRCSVNGTPGPGCLANGTDPVAAYRVGIDGPVPTPLHPVVTAPIVPSVLTVTAYDAKIKTRRTHSYNFNYQRTLPSRMVMEAGWVMRLARELPQATCSAPFLLPHRQRFASDVCGGVRCRGDTAPGGHARGGMLPSRGSRTSWRPARPQRWPSHRARRSSTET